MRHGEKAYGNDSNHKYRLDSHLTEQGIFDVSTAAFEIVVNNKIPQIIFCSSLLRTRITASICVNIFNQFGHKPHIFIVDELSEFLGNQRTVNACDFRQDSMNKYIRQGESLIEHKRRINKVYEILKSSKCNIMVIGHGFGLSIILKKYGIKKYPKEGEYIIINK